MRPVVHDLAAGAVQVAAMTTLLVTAVHSAGLGEPFRFSGWMLAVEIAAGFVAMSLLAFVIGAVFQLLSERVESVPPVVADDDFQEGSA